jgi:hypothetical protein
VNVSLHEIETEIHVSNIHNGKGKDFVSFEAFAEVMFQVEVFWVLMPCGVVVGYERFTLKMKAAWTF